MRILAFIGFIALTFGLGSHYATGEFGLFSGINVAVGALALLAAMVRGFSKLHRASARSSRQVLSKRALLLLVTLLLAIALERLFTAGGAQLDLTQDHQFELSPATLQALKALPGEINATLFYRVGDPRIQHTRLLLQTLAQNGPVRIHERSMQHAYAEMDHFEIASSNSVVLELGSHFETTERPTEGSLLEGILALTTEPDRAIYLASGEGEYDFNSQEPNNGFSGLAFALQNEGFQLKELVMASVTEIPGDAALVIFASPKRPVREASRTALARYLSRGGRLMVLQDPGYESGLETLLLEYGIAIPDGLLIDPASGPVQDAPPGVNPIISRYSKHPATTGLGPRTSTFFVSARPVIAERKPQKNDVLGALVYASPRSWVTDQLTSVRHGRIPEIPAGTSLGHHPLSVAGRYPREAGEVRIIVFGDADFASNQYLRALYNLDLIMNSVHWLTSNESKITLRPKEITPRQHPLTPQETLKMFYGVGMLLPEILLLFAAITWTRNSGA